jgi:hypothetical protein
MLMQLLLFDHSIVSVTRRSCYHYSYKPCVLVYSLRHAVYRGRHSRCALIAVQVSHFGFNIEALMRTAGYGHQ